MFYPILLSFADYLDKKKSPNLEKYFSIGLSFFYLIWNQKIQIQMFKPSSMPSNN